MPKNESEEARQHRLAMHRIHNKKYRESANGKRVKAEYAKKYRASANGKRVMAEYAKKYRQTKHGKQVIRKCVDKYQENRTCFQLANRSRVWLLADSVEANFLRLIKQEFRTPELVKSLRDPDVDMVLLMNLAKKLIPYKK